MPASSSPSLLSRIAREPTVHFLLLAGLLLLAYRIAGPDTGKELTIDWQEIDARLLVAELNALEPLTMEQRQAIEESVIDDYVLVYEAIARGLENDPRINDILAQKMRHVLAAAVEAPDAASLETYYQQHASRYQIPERITVEELVFASREPLDAALLAQLADGTGAGELETSLLYTLSTLPRVTNADLSNIFSQQFAELVFNGNDNAWQGPFVSNRGQHWLKTMQRFASEQLAFAAIEEQLRADWMSEQEELQLAREVARLRETYHITITNRPAP